MIEVRLPMVTVIVASSVLSGFAVGVRGHDPRRCLVEVYDHEQPAAGAGASAVVALPPRAGIWTPVIRGVDGCHDLLTVRSQLGVLMEYVLPALIPGDVVGFGWV
jgi:hypothetical protein